MCEFGTLFVGLALAAAVLPPADQATAASAGLSKDIPPSLLVIRLAQGRPGQRRENDFFSELGLVLGDFAIIGVDPPVEDFTELALPAQLAAVEPLIERTNAVAGVWVTSPSRGLDLIHVAAMRTGQILIRTFQAKRRAGAHTSPALAVRALLGTAYLFEPRERHEPAVSRVVEEVRQEALGEPAPVEVEPPMGLVAQMTLEKAASPHKGPDRLLGVRIGLERPILERFRLGAGVGLHSGPSLDRADTRISAWAAEPELYAAYEHESGRFRLGAFIAAWARFQSLRFTYSDEALGGRTFSYDHWQAGAAIGPRLGFLLTSGWLLGGTARIAWTPKRHFYWRNSTNKVVYSTPLYRWGVGVGLTKLLP